MGSNQNCEDCQITVPWPPGYHTFLSVMLGLFGDSEAVAFNTSAVIGSISILLIFLLFFLIFKDSTLALVGAFIFTFIPVHLKYSGASSMDVFSLFSLMLCLVSLEIHLKARKYSTFLLFLATLLYAVNSRPESLLLFFLLPFYIWIKEGSKIKKMFRVEYLAAILLFLALLIPLAELIYLGTSVLHTPGWDHPISEKISNLQKHLVPNFLFFFDNNFNSPVFSLICIVGAVKLYFDDTKMFIYHSSFLLLFLLVYSSFWQGYLDTYHGTIRYSLVLYLPSIVFFLKGVDAIIKNLHFNKKFIIILILSAYLLTILPTLNFIFSKDPLDTEYEFILSMRELPPDVYILSYNPTSIIVPLHKRSVLITFFVNNLNTSAPKNVLLFKDKWWYYYGEMSSQIEEELKKHYNFELIAQSPEGYAFYNLTLK